MAEATSGAGSANSPINSGELDRGEREPTDPQRLRSFATFFKNYMSISAVLAAAAPIPVALFDLIPQYDSLRRLTTTMSSLLAFLTLAYIFFNRAPLGRAWFGRYLLDSGGSSWTTPRQRFGARLVMLSPLFLVGLSMGSLVAYLLSLELSLNSWGDPASDVLPRAEFGEIDYSAVLIFTLLGFFVLAEAAFIVMALREYTQDLLGITDRELILNIARSAGEGDAIVRNAARLVAVGQASIAESGSAYVRVHDLNTNYTYVLNSDAFEAALAREQSEAPKGVG